MAKMAMFENSKDTQIYGGVFTLIYGNKTPMEVLLEKSAPGAFHISNERFEAPKCHPETRLAVREDIIQQIKIALVSTIIWLYGAAGAGKSSIAQTIAEMCSQEGLLIGSFFFFRTAPLRNNAQRLAASLTYQLGRSIPSTLQYISACIQKDPAIFESSLEDQLRRLFVEPLRSACMDNPELRPSHRLFILDGLDECDTPKVQQHILEVLGKILQTTPIPIVVLVASRPEPHISSIFDSPEDLSQLTTFPIGLNDKYDADADIRLYTNDRLKHIKCSHRFKKYLPEDWPTPEDIKFIVQASSGQFIFAATIVRYVECTSHKPHERLRMALDSSQRFAANVGKSPFAALDALYMQILSGVEDKVMVLAILHHVLNIEPTDPNRINALPNFSADEITRCLELVPGDVEVYLSNLSSLVKFEQQDKPIRVYHASLRDFLTDKERSQSFYILQDAVILCLAKRYLKHIDSGDYQVWKNIVIATGLVRPLLPDDKELSTILSRLEERISTTIYNYLVRWGDRDFWDFIVKVKQLSNAVELHVKNTAFWDRCLVGIHEFLKYDLRPFLAGDIALEPLAFMAFSKPMYGAYILSPPHLTPITKACWGVSEIPYCISIRNLHEYREPILHNFLLDESLSGELAILPSHFVQVALQCVRYITSVLEYNFSQWDAIYATLGLIGALEHAPRDDQLILSLKSCQSCFEYSEMPPKELHDLESAISSYLQNHLPSDLEARPTFESLPIEVPLSSEAEGHPIEVGTILKQFFLLNLDEALLRSLSHLKHNQSRSNLLPVLNSRKG